MGKATYRGLAPPDHPMFSGGFEMFSRPGSGLSATSKEAGTEETLHTDETSSNLSKEAAAKLKAKSRKAKVK